jgi:hypothetical protein
MIDTDIVKIHKGTYLDLVDHPYIKDYGSNLSYLLILLLGTILVLES